MCGDISFYASELIHAIRGLKEQGTFDTIVDVVGAFGPVIISGIALWISWRGSKNTEAIQKQIATSEERSKIRQLLLEAYSLFVDQELAYLLSRDLMMIRFPEFATLLKEKVDVKSTNMLAALNKVRLILSGNTTFIETKVLKALYDAYMVYEEFTNSVISFVDNGECLKVYNSAMLKLKKEYGDQLTQNVIFSDSEIQAKFINYSNSDTLKKIEETYKKYLVAVNDENFDIHFQNYLKELSN